MTPVFFLSVLLLMIKLRHNIVRVLWIGEWSHNKLFIPRKDFRAVRVIEQVDASTVTLSVDQTSLAGLKSCLPIKNFSSCIVYRPECHSAIRAVYNQTERWVLWAWSFNSTSRYLQSSITFVQKVCFAFGKKIRKTLSTCQKKTAVINVLIFNKLDFQNCFLPFLTLNLNTNIKSLSKSQFWKCLF